VAELIGWVLDSRFLLAAQEWKRNQEKVKWIASLQNTANVTVMERDLQLIVL
jgi:hypothetical protein